MMIMKGEKLCCLRSWQKVIRVPSISDSAGEFTADQKGAHYKT